MRDKISQCVDHNLSRVKNLVQIYTNSSTGQGRKAAHDTDVLRAAVVLLHASLEEFLRSIARWKFPEITDKEFFDKMSFPGGASPKQPNKISLGYMLDYRGKTVNELLEMSIEKHLSKTSYNNTHEISQLLISIGIDIETVNSEFGNLAEMMNRRHMIVHNADRNVYSGQGNHRVKSLGIKPLKKWITSVRSFVNALLVQL